jgi:hypothetical protein
MSIMGISAAFLDRTYGSGLFPTCLLGMHSWFQTRVAAQFPQYVLGQDVFERILRRRRAFATQSISDKSLASDSYELRHANPMLQKKHHHDETEHGDKKWLQIAF